MYNVSRYPAKATISATNHSVPEILFRKIMSGYSGTCEKNKTRFHEKYCDSLFLFRCAFPIYFPNFFLESYHKIRQVFLKDSKLKKHTSRARFRSSDLWVMGPARFHCATLLHMLSSKCNLCFSQNYERFRKVQKQKSNQKYCTSKYLIISSNQNNKFQCNTLILT